MAKTNDSGASEPLASGSAEPRAADTDRNGGESSQVATPVFVGYARVSTVEQEVARQVDALEAAGCARIFVDQGVSGSVMSRPQLGAALGYLRNGDVLTILSLDRLGRNVRGVLELIDHLEARGIGLKVLQLGLDTTTPSGRLVLTVLLAVAQLEREHLSERTRQGLEAARRRGRVGGRPRALSAAQIRALEVMRSEGASLAECAEAFAVSERTVSRYVKGAGACS